MLHRASIVPLLLLGLSAAPSHDDLVQAIKVIRPAQTSDQRFPPDAFANPAFRVAWLDQEPLRNATAHALLFGDGVGSSSGDELSLANRQHAHAGDRRDGGGHASSSSGNGSSSSTLTSALGGALSGPLDHSSHSLELHFVDRDSPYLCAIPRINSTADKYRSSPESYPQSTIELLEEALALLEPLKSALPTSQTGKGKATTSAATTGAEQHNPASFTSNCLYYTFDWFTYAYCHGQHITQFRAAPTTVGAAADALAERSPDGRKQPILKRIEPRKDPIWPAFVLGRWSHEIERMLDEDGTRLYVIPAGLNGATTAAAAAAGAGAPGQQQQELMSQLKAEGSSSSSSRGRSGLGNKLAILPVSSVDPSRAHIHTALIEVVAFDDPAVRNVVAEKEKDGARFLRAAENAAKSAARRASPSSSSSSSDVDLASKQQQGQDGHAGGSSQQGEQQRQQQQPAIAQRYISQTWSDGTPCVSTGEPREIEVQYHCVPSTGLYPVDRISMVRETTVCKYVIVIETSRLCAIPALAVNRRSANGLGDSIGEDAYSIDCRPIVRDDWDGEAALREIELEQKRLEEEDRREAIAVHRRNEQKQQQQAALLSDTKKNLEFTGSGVGVVGEGEGNKPAMRKETEERIIAALSGALSEYFGLDAEQTKDFFRPQSGTGADESSKQGGKGSREEYYDATDGAAATAASERGEGDGDSKKARLNQLGDIVNRAMGEIGTDGNAVKVLELSVGEDGVIRSATLTTPTATAAGAGAGAAKAEATHASGSSTDADGGDPITDEEIVDALFDELGLSDWLDGAVASAAAEKTSSGRREDGRLSGGKEAQEADSAVQRDAAASAPVAEDDEAGSDGPAQRSGGREEGAGVHDEL